MHDPVALALLAVETGQLVRDLSSWQQVGSLAELLVSAAHGHDALGGEDVRRLRCWARRWRGLPAGLRAFYAEAAVGDESCSVALWHVLEGRPHDLRTGTIGAVHRCYARRNAMSPPWTLFPRVP